MRVLDSAAWGPISLLPLKQLGLGGQYSVLTNGLRRNHMIYTARARASRTLQRDARPLILQMTSLVKPFPGTRRDVMLAKYFVKHVAGATHGQKKTSLKTRRRTCAHRRLTRSTNR